MHIHGTGTESRKDRRDHLHAGERHQYTHQRIASQPELRCIDLPSRVGPPVTRLGFDREIIVRRADAPGTKDATETNLVLDSLLGHARVQLYP